MNSKKPGFPLGIDPFEGKVDELEKLAGLPGLPKTHDYTDDIARRFKQAAPAEVATAPTSSADRLWNIHKRFNTLYDRHGKPFVRFLGDILDILVSGPHQTKIVNELISKKIKKHRKLEKADPLSPEHVARSSGGHKDITIGGEPRHYSHHYLKRKTLLASLFLESEEYETYVFLMKNIAEICERECPDAPWTALSAAERQTELETTIAGMKAEISRENLLKAWMILEANEFERLEWVFQTTKDLGLVRPSFYEDLDKAYREAKRLLKLITKEFETEFPPLLEKKDFLLDYLNDILEVFTHHHFVLKHYNSTRMVISRHDVEQMQKEHQTRLESLKQEALALREDLKKVQRQRDEAQSKARQALTEQDQLKEKLQKFDPREVERQRNAMESKLNQMTRENQALIEGDAELRTAFRKLETENQHMTQRLRDLNAIPDEQAKSVEGRLIGKRVAIFGGVSRDHYLAVLKEAGVQDEEYEWVEGYQTIPQSRTSDIVGRCHLCVVITSYAGHLHLWQCRNAVTPGQLLIPIHNSGAGSLRQAIIEKFPKTI